MQTVPSSRIPPGPAHPHQITPRAKSHVVLLTLTRLPRAQGSPPWAMSLLTRRDEPESQRGSPFSAGREGSTAASLARPLRSPALPRSLCKLSAERSTTTQTCCLVLEKQKQGLSSVTAPRGPSSAPRPPAPSPHATLTSPHSSDFTRPPLPAAGGRGAPPARGPTRPSTPGSHGPLPDAGLPPST